jgi:hypothetical protein
VWGDEAMQLGAIPARARDSFSNFSAWLPIALAEHADAGGAVLSVYCNDPDLLEHDAGDRAGALQQATVAQRDALSRADLAQSHELGGRRGARMRRGPRSLSRGRAEQSATAVGHDRAPVPSRSSGSGAAWREHLAALHGAQRSG